VRRIKDPELVYVLLKLILVFGYSAYQAAKEVAKEEGVSFERLWELIPKRYR